MVFIIAKGHAMQERFTRKTQLNANDNSDNTFLHLTALQAKQGEVLKDTNFRIEEQVILTEDLKRTKKTNIADTFKNL